MKNTIKTILTLVIIMAVACIGTRFMDYTLAERDFLSRLDEIIADRGETVEYKVVERDYTDGSIGVEVNEIGNEELGGAYIMYENVFPNSKSVGCIRLIDWNTNLSYLSTHGTILERH